MPQEDFDIQSLAEYLHLTPPQVTKLVERGKVPGRKVGGQWRFSQAEIHHWLEDRIGASDVEELSDVEAMLERRRQAQKEEPISLLSMLPAEAITVPLTSRSRGKVIHEMIETAARTGLLWDPDRMEDAVRARESLHPTALDNGVALLHPRRPLANILAEPLLAFGRTTAGIPFGSESGTLTDLFFLILSTDDSGHLAALARISRLVSNYEALTALREAETPYEVREAIAHFEEQNFVGRP